MGIDADIRRQVAAVQRWAGTACTIEPLNGGITNSNFIVTTPSERAVVRRPGERTELLAIRRDAERQAAIQAAELGIAPPILGELPGYGTLITEFIDGRHAEGQAFVEQLPAVVAVLRTWHQSGELLGRFPIHRVVEWHRRDAHDNGVKIPHLVDWLHLQSTRIEEAFGRNVEPDVPCHNDLLPGNVLFDQADRPWLLDFEYAGMNSRYFDLGNLSVNCGFDTSADERLLALYFGAPPTRQQRARLALMKVMSEFREGMWAVVQQAISVLDTDFVSYAQERLGNAERLANSAEFEDHLANA